MKKIRASTTFQNRAHIKSDRGVARSGTVHVVPDNVARQLVEQKGYAVYVEEENDDETESGESGDKNFTPKAETSETKPEEKTTEKSLNNFKASMIPQGAFPSTVFGIMKSAGIHTFGDLMEYEGNFEDITGIGPAYASDIEKHLREAKKHYLGS
jgi:hypothetical protein